MLIVGVSGSLQRESGNLALLRTAAATAPGGVEVRIVDDLRHLPPFDPDLDGEGVADPVVRWRAALAEADAILIATPEYGHSLPGALKNGIDWVIGSGELNRKVVGITAAVPAVERGRRGLDALRTTLLAVDAVVVGSTPIVRGPAFEDDVAELMRDVVAHALRS